jgi:hypothetical protein
MGPVILAISRTVGRSKRPRRRERAQLMPPGIPAFGKVVAQHDRRPGPILRYKHADAIGFDDAMHCHLEPNLAISSLGTGFAIRRAAYMCGEKSGRLLFRISGRRLIVFEPMAEKANTRLELRDVEGMKSPRIDGQSVWRAVRAWATISRHRSAGVESSPRDQKSESAPSSWPPGCHSGNTTATRNRCVKCCVAESRSTA